jgi:hypothetical protein
MHKLDSDNVEKYAAHKQFKFQIAFTVAETCSDTENSRDLTQRKPNGKDIGSQREVNNVDFRLNAQHSTFSMRSRHG